MASAELLKISHSTDGKVVGVDNKVQGVSEQVQDLDDKLDNVNRSSSPHIPTPRSEGLAILRKPATRQSATMAFAPRSIHES